MDTGGVQATFAATLVDEWVRGGASEAVICPGSRSTPLAVALWRHPGIRCHIRLDERSAGFFALGLALGNGRPAIVCTTSGTAAAELHAAVVEAHHGRVPLVVCTADRPPELHDVGANQTIEQVGLYGGALRWSWNPGVPDPATTATWRPMAARALIACSHDALGPGPVHVNLAFREPLIGDTDPLPPGRPDGRPWHEVMGEAAPVDADIDAAVKDWPARRGLIVAGQGAGDPKLVLALAETLSWPVLADPRSRCRVDHELVVGAADAILRSPKATALLEPELVLRLGSPWASKVLAEFLKQVSERGTEVVAVDPWQRWMDPDGITAHTWHVDPDRFLGAVSQACTQRHAAAPSDWAKQWMAAEHQAQEIFETELLPRTGPTSVLSAEPVSEPALARHLIGCLPAGCVAVVSSSMPIRDVEWYAPPRSEPPAVLSNRGASGIDGVCSTALGVAASCDGPVVALVGDLAFLHDLSGLVRFQTEASSPYAQTSCTIVVVDNQGGGIFSFLSQASELDQSLFEACFATSPDADIAGIAGACGAHVEQVTTLSELEEALGRHIGRPGISVIRATVPSRQENVLFHERLWTSVARRLESHLDPSS